MNQLVFMDVQSRSCSEAYLKQCRTCKMERFPKIGNNFQPLTIFIKHPILDIWQGSEYASVIANEIMPWVFVNGANLIIYCSFLLYLRKLT